MAGRKEEESITEECSRFKHLFALMAMRVNGGVMSCSYQQNFVLGLYFQMPSLVPN
jgi:hypothetical protein